MNSLSSKTKETAFPILNHTTWTHNTPYKSRKRDNPNCDYCGKLKLLNIYTTTVKNLLRNYGQKWGTVSLLPLLHTLGMKYRQFNSLLLK